MSAQIKLFAYLWYLGLRESLQVQRCIVLLALDEDNVLWGKIWDCIKLHGGIFLGSLAWWRYIVDPCVTWLLVYTLAPVSGPGTAHAVRVVLDHVSQVLWMAPAYAITLLVSCSWYNDVAERAVHVRQQHNARLRATPVDSIKAGVGSSHSINGSFSQTGGSGAANGGPAGGDSAYVGAAQELYRVTLFAVMYAEIYVTSLIPVIGYGMSQLFTCWLYAYYCYDYQWTLRGIKLQDRLALFEGCAPFFAGYGLILTTITAVLPFYMGAALMSLLFPVFVLVACDSHVMSVIFEAVNRTGTGITPNSQASSTARPATPPTPLNGAALADQIRFRIPVFWMAAWPTQLLLNAVFAKRQGVAGSTSGKNKMAASDVVNIVGSR